MRADLERIFRAGVAACLPERVVPRHLPQPPSGRVLVLAVGKAAAGMAAAAERGYGAAVQGVAVVPHGVEAKLERVALLHAGHPLPDEAGVAAAERLMAVAGGAGADDLVLVLLSGGASALACLPGEGLGLEEKRRVADALLRSGAPVGEVNCVRRHLSRIKGGRLALAAAPAKLVTLAISDVAGDRPEDIGSGPTAADPTTLAGARAVLDRHGIRAPAAGWSETVKAVPSGYRVVARAADALAAAAGEALRLGYRPLLLGERYGDAVAAAEEHAERALEAPPGTALISGGELSVRLEGGGGGRGGRSHVFALAAAARLAGRSGIAGLAADTDGVDGTSGAAGAFFDGSTAARSRRPAAGALVAGDSGGFFESLGDQLVTGPTGTNVNDLRILLVAP